MRTRINKFIRYFFGISHREANGVMVLGLGLIIVIGAFLVIINWDSTGAQQLDENQAQKLDSLAKAIDDQITLANLEDSSESMMGEALPKNKSAVYFPFDPNLATKEDFLKLGLSKEISNRIVKYRDSGGKFYKANDLKKIYGLKEHEYEKLLPFISIQPQDRFTKYELDKPPNDSLITKSIETIIVRFDINQVDSTALIQVNGIGKVLSGRIVKFRESLGGFVSLNQLNDIYGIEEYARNNLIEQSFIVETFTPRKIKINQWPADSMVRHPYVDYKTANIIIAYRDQHGSFSKAEDLLGIQIIESSWIDKIAPYLEF